ncbi:hypothetical protein [Lichenicoccus roseus]|nr:hypothetical protein [Lichenicoccus roseus]
MEGVATLVDDPELRVRTKFNPRTQKMDIRLIQHKSPVIENEKGEVSFQVLVDETELHTLPLIIQRERKRRRLPPATEQEMSEILDRASRTVTVRQNPNVLFNLTVKFKYLEHSLLKIIYELAFLWLGETYLDDPRASELRSAVTSADPAIAQTLMGYCGDAGSSDLFPLWLPHRAHHLAFATVINERIAICLRIFDIFAATAWITADANRYLNGTDGRDVLRFLTIDASTRKMLSSPFLDEVMRVVRKKGESQTVGAVPDPLCL